MGSSGMPATDRPGIVGARGEDHRDALGLQPAGRRRRTRRGTRGRASARRRCSRPRAPRGSPRPASERVASPTRNRSGGDPDSRPNATRRASRCRAGIRSSPSRNGSSARCTAENDNCASDSTPARRTTRTRSAAAAWSSSAVLPMPASPTSTSAPLTPLRADVTSASSACRSAARPSRGTGCFAMIHHASGTRSRRLEILAKPADYAPRVVRRARARRDAAG